MEGYLTIEYNLDTSVREKPVMNIDGVFLVLYHLWILDESVFPDERKRLQLGLLILLSAYTASAYSSWIEINMRGFSFLREAP